MDVRQLSVKLFAERDARSASFDQDRVIPVFHRWIRDKQVSDHLMIDVADYRHVPEGPGVMLIANEAHIAVDSGSGGLGLVYSPRRDSVGDLRDKFRHSARTLFATADALAAEPSLDIGFASGTLLVTVMCRLSASNVAGHYQQLHDGLTPVVQRLFGDSATLSWFDKDPRAPLSLKVEGGSARSPGELLAAL